jgi:hypothetical protein
LIFIGLRDENHAEQTFECNGFHPGWRYDWVTEIRWGRHRIKLLSLGPGAGAMIKMSQLETDGCFDTGG